MKSLSHEEVPKESRRWIPCPQGTCEIPSSPQRGLEENASTGDLSPTHPAAAQSGSQTPGRRPAGPRPQCRQVCIKSVVSRLPWWSRLRLSMHTVSVRLLVGVAKIPHALGPKHQNIKQKQCNKFNKKLKKKSNLGLATPAGLW